VTSDEDLETADATNLENIQQVETRMSQAATGFDANDVSTLYADFAEAFAEWKDRSRNVIKLASTPSKLQFARKASDTGSALKTFTAMRALLDQLQQAQEVHIQGVMAKLEEKREKTLVLGHSEVESCFNGVERIDTGGRVWLVLAQ
jgi:methyl-accepting chemotaxis protein